MTLFQTIRIKLLFILMQPQGIDQFRNLSRWKVNRWIKSSFSEQRVFSIQFSVFRFSIFLLFSGVFWSFLVFLAILTILRYWFSWLNFSNLFVKYFGHKNYKKYTKIMKKLAKKLVLQKSSKPNKLIAIN